MTRARATPPPSAEATGGFVAALASLQFGGVVVLGKVLSRTDLTVAATLAIRFGIAAGVLAGALAATGRPLRAAPGEGRVLAGLGVAGYAVEAGLFFAALHHGTASAVTLLFFTYPVIVALALAAVGRGTPGRLVAASLVSAVAGAAIVVASSGGLDISATGIGLSLGSAAVFALYLVGAELGVARTPSLTSAMWVSGSAAAALALVAAATGGGADAPPDPASWARVVGIGVATAGAFVCLFAALRLLGAVRTSIVSAMEPLTASVFAAIFLGERLRGGTIAGGALILAGAITASAARRPPDAEEASEPPVP